MALTGPKSSKLQYHSFTARALTEEPVVPNLPHCGSKGRMARPFDGLAVGLRDNATEVLERDSIPGEAREIED